MKRKTDRRAPWRCRYQRHRGGAWTTYLRFTHQADAERCARHLVATRRYPACLVLGPRGEETIIEGPGPAEAGPGPVPVQRVLWED